MIKVVCGVVAAVVAARVLWAGMGKERINDYQVTVVVSSIIGTTTPSSRRWRRELVTPPAGSSGGARLVR